MECYGIIYKIKNKINNKVYIGQTIEGFDKRYKYKGNEIEKVYKYHQYRLTSGNYYNEHLLKSIDKYGFGAFEVIKTFDIAFSKEELDIKEDVWINYFNCVSNGYNNMTGGSRGSLSDISKAKISKTMKGRNHSINRKINISKGLMNNKQIICFTTSKIFDTLLEGAKYYNCNEKKICDCCNGRRKNHGKLKDGTKLEWFYYFNNKIIYPKDISYGNNKKEVYCITTKRKFKSVSDAGRFYNCSKSGISKCCKNKRKMCGQLSNGVKLQWRFCE